MFGYLRPQKAELRIREFEAFRAVYCGLCHQLGRSFGPLARLTLSYDFVFLAMLSYAVSGREPVICRGRCAVNPLKRVPLCGSDEILSFSADAAAVMIYYNLLDKMEDGGVLHKLGGNLVRPAVSAAKKKACLRDPETGAVLERLFHSQRLVEREGESVGADRAAEPTATALAALFENLSQDTAQRRVLERLGYFTGRYIYQCDALEDFESDLKSGSFNPLVNRFRSGPQTEEGKRLLRDDAKKSLLMTSAEAGRALGLLEMKHFSPVLENIVYLGMTEQAERILSDKKLGGCKRS